MLQLGGFQPYPQTNGNGAAQGGGFPGFSPQPSPQQQQQQQQAANGWGQQQ
jgi:hypothetical protein